MCVYICPFAHVPVHVTVSQGLRICASGMAAVGVQPYADHGGHVAIHPSHSYHTVPCGWITMRELYCSAQWMSMYQPGAKEGLKGTMVAWSRVANCPELTSRGHSGGQLHRCAITRCFSASCTRGTQARLASAAELISLVACTRCTNVPASHVTFLAVSSRAV